MAKGYWVALVDVKNQEVMKRYAAANPAIFKKFGDEFWFALANSKSPKALAARAMS